MSARGCVFLAAVLLAACTEFPNTPPLAFTIDTTSGWRDTVSVADVDTFRIRVSLASGERLSGVQVLWQSSDPAKLELTPLLVASGRAEDSLTAQLSTIVIAHARDSAVMVTATVEQPGLERRSMSRPVTVMERWVSVTSGVWNTCAITVRSAAYCWGANGTIGNGSFAGGPIPRRVKGAVGDLEFESVSSGGTHTCGVARSSALFCWGFNFSGEVGIGTFSQAVLLPSLTLGAFTYKAVGAGGRHTCGITKGGAITSVTDLPTDVAVCWGSGDWGQLGNGRVGFENCGGLHCQSSPSTPVTPPLVVPPPPPLGLVQLASGEVHSCAVATDSTAYCWGSNEVGALGTNRVLETCTLSPNVFIFFDCSKTAIQVSNAIRFRQLAAGGEHSCGITLTGDALCWGRNQVRQLGAPAADTTETCIVHLESTISVPSQCSRLPVRVLGGLKFQSITAGGAHTCGVATGGLVYCWGINDSSQVGSRAADVCVFNRWSGTAVVVTSRPCSRVPVTVSSVLRFASVSAGRTHTCGVTVPDGAIYCWGDNQFQQLGRAVGGKSPVPVRIEEPESP